MRVTGSGRPARLGDPRLDLIQLRVQRPEDAVVRPGEHPQQFPCLRQCRLGPRQIFSHRGKLDLKSRLLKVIIDTL